LSRRSRSCFVGAPTPEREFAIVGRYATIVRLPLIHAQSAKRMKPSGHARMHTHCRKIPHRNQNENAHHFC
jgi:hypothetical protein